MSIYSQATLGEPDNYITFNDYSANPVFRTMSRMPQRYQLRQQDVPIPFESGVSDFLTLIGSTVYTIAGKMYPYDEASYDTGLAKLRAIGSLDLQQADTYATDEGYVPYVWSEALRSKQVFLKVLYAQVMEDTRQGFVQPFQLICKIKDPIIFGATLKLATTGASNPTQTTGSAAYSFTYPVVYGATLYSGSADATNAGDLPVYPVSIQVTGPVNTPKITNQKTGEYITVNVNLTSGTDVLLLQYGKDKLSVTLNGVSVVNKVTSDSTYFKIKPGTNTILLSGTSVSTGAVAIVSFYDAWNLA